MKPLLTSVVLIALIGVFASCASAIDQAPQDKKIGKLLDEIKYNYQVDKDGDYLVMIRTEENKIQHIWINSATVSFYSVEIREIWAVAYRSNSPFSAETKNSLLKRNCVIMFGAWSVVPDNKNGEAIVFRAKLPATLNAKNLEDVITFVLITISGMEDELAKEATKKEKIWSPF
jgi:hypothetical protein